jgi:hypothetical protein
MSDEPLLDSRELGSDLRAFTVTNGTLGPVLWCPACDHQIGYLSDRVSLAVLLADARRHVEARCA